MQLGKLGAAQRARARACGEEMSPAEASPCLVWEEKRSGLMDEAASRRGEPLSCKEVQKGRVGDRAGAIVRVEALP